MCRLCGDRLRSFASLRMTNSENSWFEFFTDRRFAFIDFGSFNSYKMLQPFAVL